MQSHFVLEHFFGVAFPVMLGHVKLGLPVFLVHLFHGTLGFLQLFVHHV